MKDTNILTCANSDVHSENLNDAITAIVQLDFKILDRNEGLIQTRVSDTLCHFLGIIILNNLRAYNLENPYNSLMKIYRPLKLP